MAEKRCFKCLEALPLSEFYRHPRMADGHLGKCKRCAILDVRANRASRREQYNEYDRARSRTPERRAVLAATMRRMRAKYPEKYAARNAVNNAVRDGRLQKEPCEVCGVLRVEAHHEDYTKPLVVRWLCIPHHKLADHA